MFPVLQIGPFAVQVPGLIILGGLWAGLTLSERLVEKRRNTPMSPAQVTNLALLSILAGIIGARLGYLLLFPSAFSLNPLTIVSLNPGLLDPWFGFSTAVLAAAVISQRNRFSAKLVLDVFTPFLAGLSAAISLSNLASGVRYGLPTQMPWAVELFGANRHPAQLYDFLAAAVILAIIWQWRKTYELGEGKLFFIFLALSSAAFLFLEAFHATGPSLLDGWRVVQILAWLALAVSLWFLRKLGALQGP